ncbi:hypothetical protein cypCar_00044894 [Cyprinus carpio]|nr:hypothetical protein cypCar_00044894 [Cyprinus carpio]
MRSLEPDSSVRSDTELLKKMFHMFVLFCLCWWRLIDQTDAFTSFCIITALDGQSTSQPVSLIVLSSAAGSLLIVAVVGIFWFCRKHRKTDQEGKLLVRMEFCCFNASIIVETVERHEEEITYAAPVFYKRNTQKSKVQEDDHVDYAPITEDDQTSVFF